MLVLTEQIEIPASYEKLEAWTANFEEEFVKWSPCLYYLCTGKLICCHRYFKPAYGFQL